MINFSIIGTDSALFNNPVHDVFTFDLGAGERVELLIRLAVEDGVPSNITKFYLICSDGLLEKYVVKERFLLSNITVPSKNKYSAPDKTAPLPIPFKDLSVFPKNKIAVNRMRGLFNRPSE